MHHLLRPLDEPIHQVDLGRIAESGAAREHAVDALEVQMSRDDGDRAALLVDHGRGRGNGRLARRGGRVEVLHVGSEAAFDEEEGVDRSRKQGAVATFGEPAGGFAPLLAFTGNERADQLANRGIPA